MSELNQKFDRVRIVYLPPMTVASIHRQVFQSDRNPEDESAKLLDKFIADTDLKNVYPQARHFGCGNPDPPYEDSERGYERWISIPDDMEVPAPLVKKHIPGGMYAAYGIKNDEWDEYSMLHNWVDRNEKYDFRWGTLDDGQCKICGWIEEHLNYWNWTNDENHQWDIMIPIKEKV